MVHLSMCQPASDFESWSQQLPLESMEACQRTFPFFDAAAAAAGLLDLILQGSGGEENIIEHQIGRLITPSKSEHLSEPEVQGHGARISDESDISVETLSPFSCS